jgi:hypothetical protein
MMMQPDRCFLPHMQESEAGCENRRHADANRLMWRVSHRVRSAVVLVRSSQSIVLSLSYSEILTGLYLLYYNNSNNIKTLVF